MMKKQIPRLPDSELNIMLVLWNGHPGMSRPEIEAVVNQKKKLAPTTILSLLARLESKGFVSVRKEKQMNYYTPRISKDDYQSQESRTILEKLYGNSLKNFVSSLYHGRAVEEEDIRELENYLRDLETEKNDRHK